MAPKILLLILFAITTLAEASPMPAEWTAAADKSIADMNKKMQEAFDGIYMTDVPAAQKKQALNATMRQEFTVGITLAKAKDKGDEKKLVKIARSYELASETVIAAPPAEKLRVMEDAFNAVAAPDPKECPSIDKPFCETFSKLQKAFHGVVTAAPPGKEEETLEAVSKQRYGTRITINKAYAEDDKRVPGVLAAYGKAAGEVIAAPPPEKLKVMEEAFAASTAHPGARMSARAER